MKSIRTNPTVHAAEGDERIRTAVPAPGDDLAYEPRADEGDRFDPFCHTLDAEGRALCFADISGRRVHNRNLGTSGSAGPTHCQTCQKALCPTCVEAERQMFGAAR